MAMTIGRATGLRPLNITPSGDMLLVEGAVLASTLAAKKAIRQQLLAAVGNGDELWLPVVWDVDPTFDGMYQLESASTSRIGVEDSADMTFSVALRPARNRRKPLIEVAHLQALATNSHSVTGYLHSLFTPEYDQTYVGIGTTETSETGNVYSSRTPSASPGSIFYVGDPATFYNGSCKLELDDGTTWNTMVGRDLLSDPGLTGWRLNNGRIRVTVTSGGKLVTECWDGAWEDSKTWRHQDINYPGAEPTTGWNGLTILRNSVEVVTIRVYALKNSVTYGRTMDLTIRRGMPFVEIVVKWSGLTSGASWLRDSAEAATAATAGVVATTATNGNKYFVGSPNAITKNTVTGGVEQSSSLNTQFQAVIGYDINSGTGQGWEVPSVSCFAGSEVQRVIGL